MVVEVRPIVYTYRLFQRSRSQENELIISVLVITFVKIKII